MSFNLFKKCSSVINLRNGQWYNIIICHCNNAIMYAKIEKFAGFLIQTQLYRPQTITKPFQQLVRGNASSSVIC